MKSRLPILILLAAGFSGMVSAQPYYPQSAAPFDKSRLAQQQGPAVILRQGLRNLMDFAGGEHQPSRIQAEAFLEREIAPYFDFAYMASWAVGESVWQRMGEGQRQELEEYIKQDFLTTLAVRMTGFGDQQVQLSPPRSVAANEVMVAVSILNPQAYPARLNFRFYRAEDGWKVFDVTANGSSAVMHYRNQFRRMMRERMMHRQGYRR
jgi:phospholipid transport system substrate-binding protein